MKKNKIFLTSAVILGTLGSTLAFTSCGGSNKELKSIAVTTKPTKSTYYAGEDLDTTGMIVTGTYSDGSTAEIPAKTGEQDGYTLSKTGELSTSDKTIKVTYSTFTTNLSLTVNSSLFIQRAAGNSTEYGVSHATNILTTYTLDENPSKTYIENWTDAEGTVQGQSYGHFVTATFTFTFVTKVALKMSFVSSQARYEDVNCNDVWTTTLDGKTVSTASCALGKGSGDNDHDRYWNWKTWNAITSTSLAIGAHTLSIKTASGKVTPNIKSFQFKFAA